MTYTIEHYDNRQAWLEARQRGIGASDAAAVLGLSGYASPYSVWFAKTEPLRDEPMDEIQRWGLLLEPVILEEFNRVAQPHATAVAIQPFTIYRDTQRQHICCSLDAIAESNRPVQLKTAHFAAAKVWKHEVPIGYLAQVQQEIYVMDADWGYIAVLKDGYEFVYHRVNRHQKFIDRMLAKLDRFWERYVIGREAPPTDFSQATADALARKYPTANGAAVELPAELEPLIAEYDELTKTESAATKRKDEIKNLLKSKIGDARYGSFGSKDGFQWNGDGGKRTFRRAKNCPEPVSS